jgi:acetyltransferase-like isoleucine patch superfamily enzyme
MEGHVFGRLWAAELELRGASIASLGRLTIIGRPIVRLAYGSSVRIGRDVIFMSNSKYCLSSSLYAPCKLATHFPSAHIEIGDGASFNGTSLTCRSTTISIGARTMIGPNVMISDSPYHPLWPLEVRNHYPGNELDAAVTIGDDVWIAAQVIILPGARIGRGSVIGAGSLVSGEIPPGCLAVGRPAKVIRRLESQSGIDARTAAQHGTIIAKSLND